MKTGKLVIEQKSKFGFDKTVQLLTAAAEKYEWKVPFVHDLQQSLAKSGQTVKPVKVIEICKPKYSGKMLELNDERIISVMMPCRISVYEKDDGKTYIGLMNMAELVTSLPTKMASVMRAAADETLEIVQTVV
jgi:uncharacterized protein (DUF302 family)